MKTRPSIKYLRQCFHYTGGHLFWKKRPRSHFKNEHAWAASNSKCQGKEAGCLAKFKTGGSRWFVCVSYFRTTRYQIVWALHRGAWAKCDLDHRDRNSLNDKIGNLRLANHKGNAGNTTKHSNNTSGYKGVFLHEGKRWRAQIRVDGKSVHLGTFPDPETAYAAYIVASKKHFGDFHCG